jgi:2-polyprenyl-6-methoxyphenol hydroxylase-like FAD-dependent oxidoreductase
MQTDVLVIGAGPTGLALANQLARFGVDFLIVDKREGTTPHSRAIGVQARTLEIYDQMGIANDLISKGWHADKVRLVGGGEVRGELNLQDIGKGLSPYPFLLIVEQGLHETLLYDHLRSSGSDVSWLTEMESFSQNDTSVSATLIRNGIRSEISARFLVGCDGAHSPVRHALGLRFEGSTFERLFYVADVDIDWECEHDSLYVNLGDDTLTAFFPMVGDRRWRIVGTFPEGHEKEASEIAFDEIEQQVASDTSLKFDITNIHWSSVYKVHSRAVERFSSGRCFLAGDAAHIHTPAGAQGMNTGIQDGYNLAWKLAYATKHEAPETLLDTYNEERLPNAKRLLSTTDRIFDLAASDEWIVSFLRKNVFPYVAGVALNFDVVKRIVFPLVSQIGINYRESPLSETEGSFEAVAGDRMPWFELDGRSIYHVLHTPSFHLIVFSDGTGEIPSLPNELMLKWKGLVDSHFYPLDNAVRKAFGCDRSFFVILRPDNYIGLISDEFSQETVEAYLSKIC